MQVSIGSAETMADSFCITELKETIEKMNAELIQSYTKISELTAEVREQDAKIREQDAKIREQEEGLSAAQKEISNLREDNAQLARDLKESEEKCRAVQEMLELAEQRLALFSQKPDATAEEGLAQVSIGGAGTMADSCCIAELKETIEKVNAELIQSHTKISELNAKVREQDECLSAAQTEMSNLREENAQVQTEMGNLREENAQLARGLKESEEKCRAVQEKLELAEQKLALFSQKPDATAEEYLAQVNETNDDALNINSLPNEIILKVFSYLEQNQLGQIARVCRRWYVLTKSPVLWKMVNVKFSPSHRYQYIVAESFINRLPSRVSSIRLDFMEYEEWIEPLRFAKFCEKLQQKCPHLEKLMLINSKLYDILPSVIDICTLFLQDVKNLVFHHCIFFGYPVSKEFGCASKIEVLDLSYSLFEPTYVLQFSKMPCLKVLCLSGTYIGDSWFKDESSFLNRLHVLNVGYTNVIVISLPAMLNHGHNLKELYLCKVDLKGLGITLNNSTSPHLKTICLSYTYVTCEDVVSLIQSSPSLENVYVHEDVAESFAAHPFIVANRCKLGIVKTIGLIHEHNADYLHS